MRCPEVTVIFVDKSNGYTPTGTETYPFEEYIAGVIRGEVLGLNNLEIYYNLSKFIDIFYYNYIFVLILYKFLTEPDNKDSFKLVIKPNSYCEFKFISLLK